VRPARCSRAVLILDSRSEPTSILEPEAGYAMAVMLPSSK
jgi:hypothetical protein